jgi:diguanylate cyclase (GGDEF)-like protein
MTLSKYDSAVASAEAGRRLAARTGQRAGEARALSNLGSIAQRRGDPERAVRLFAQALVIQRALGDTHEIANSLNNLGFVYSTDLAEYDRSLGHHLEALRLREQLRDSGAIALSLNNIGIVYDRLRQYDRALVHFRRALAIRRALDLQPRIAATLDNIGSVYLEIDSLDRALDAHRESLEIRDRQKDRSAVSLAHRNVGMVYLAMHRPTDARREVREALRIGDSVGDRGLGVRNRLSLSAIERARGHAAEAQQAATEALAIARTMNSRDLQMRAWEELSNAQAAAGRYADALASYRAFKAASDSIFDAGTTRRVAVLESRAAEERRAHEVAQLHQHEQMLQLEAGKRTLQRDAVSIGAILLGLVGFAAYRRRVERSRLAEAMSVTDALTGVNNRRYFQQIIDLEVAGSLRLHHAAAHRREPVRDADLVVLLLDIDHFKQINDKYGHAGGDRLLVEIAHVLQQVSRESDVLVRWGGEEFLVLGRFADRAQAGVYAERIRRAVEAHVTTLDAGQTLRVTCSVGFSVFPFDPATPDAVGWEQIVSLADHGAYTAKRLGRNRSVGYVAGAGGLPESTHHATAADLQAWIAAGRLQCVTPDAAPEIAAAIA